MEERRREAEEVDPRKSKVIFFITLEKSEKMDL